uniref:Wall-associated receptor kinase C-terminal domain-containing protein n=1 Tax=Oryza barthii TaxID=65489 RepID=A0A0D3HIM7_9ORYZ
MSSILALSLLAVSRANSELLFSANCSRTPPTGSLPVNCTAAAASGSCPWTGCTIPAAPPRAVDTYSVVPVLPWSELRSARDYAGLVRRGFLLEWTAVPGDCAACNASGGECRYDAGAMAFGCFCPGGRLQPATCGEAEEPETQDDRMFSAALHSSMCSSQAAASSTI